MVFICGAFRKSARSIMYVNYGAFDALVFMVFYGSFPMPKREHAA